MNTAAFLLVFSMLVLAFSGYMLMRNNWVFRERRKILDACQTHDDLAAFRAMPGYEKMFWRFWCWDIEKLKQH